MITEVTARLTNAVGDTHFRILWGNIYGDSKGRFVDGTHVHTSVVVRFEEENGDWLVWTKNSLYRVEWKDDVFPKTMRKYVKQKGSVDPDAKADAHDAKADEADAKDDF